MSPRQIGRRLVEQLTGDGEGRGRLEGKWGRLEVAVTDIDRLGVMIREVRLDRIPGVVRAPTLRRRLERLAERIDYLSERLILVEHDPDQTGALMRSERPREVAGELHYFELRVEKDRVTQFARFRQPPGAAARKPLPFLLDRHALARLIDDLIAAVTA